MTKKTYLFNFDILSPVYIDTRLYSILNCFLWLWMRFYSDRGHIWAFVYQGNVQKHPHIHGYMTSGSCQMQPKSLVVLVELELQLLFASKGHLSLDWESVTDTSFFF